MNLKDFDRTLVCVSIVAGLLVWAVTSVAQTPKPKHINSAIELLDAGQPIYYIGSHTGRQGGFEQGKLDAQSGADFLSYDMEAAPYNVSLLSDYMEGLVAGGPTKSGHRTPAVIAIVAAKGTDETSVRANGWMFEQVLATGVHGIILAHADTPGAVRAFVEAVRLPNREQGVGPGGVPDGRRGVHGIATAAKIWGISTDEYLKADPWPLNPNGELMLGVKIEDRYAFANLEETSKVPGLSFGESGPSDMALSMGIRTSDPRMKDVLDKILAVAKLHDLAWEGISKNDVVDKIKEGYRIGFGLEAAEIGRKYTNPTIPY
jgi:4-hydroxy-2-oxoheptanedioate aldolase